MILYIKKDYVNNDIEVYHEMIKILFLIPNLGHGGAEKVLVNLVNNLDKSIFDITLMSLYDEGVNRKFLSKEIHYLFWMKHSFPGVSHIMKIFSPKFLYNHCIRGSYNIVISYLEGQTARIVSGCTDPSVKKICWIHRTMASLSEVVRPFRSRNEAIHCYRNFDYIVSVSEDVKKAFLFSCFCGLRISDVRALLWKDVIYDSDKIHIELRQKKTEALLYLPLNKQAQCFLPTNRGNVEECIFSLPSQSTISKILNRWAKDAGIDKKVCYHMSRHTFATMELTMGADLYTTSLLMGHSNVQITQIYAKIIDVKKEQAVMMIDALFNEP